MSKFKLFHAKYELYDGKDLACYVTLIKGEKGWNGFMHTKKDITKNSLKCPVIRGVSRDKCLDTIREFYDRT